MEQRISSLRRNQPPSRQQDLVPQTIRFVSREKCLKRAGPTSMDFASVVAGIATFTAPIVSGKALGFGFPILSGHRVFPQGFAVPWRASTAPPTAAAPLPRQPRRPRGLSRRQRLGPGNPRHPWVLQQLALRQLVAQL